jgi:hypothetical protein
MVSHVPPVNHKQWNRLNKERATQQRENYDTDGCAPSEWLQVVQELRDRGLLYEEDELPVEDDSGCISNQADSVTTGHAEETVKVNC